MKSPAAAGLFLLLNLQLSNLICEYCDKSIALFQHSGYHFQDEITAGMNMLIL
jgi:hypothetical protein